MFVRGARHEADSILVAGGHASDGKHQRGRYSTQGWQASLWYSAGPVTTSTTGCSVENTKPAVFDQKVSQTSFEKSRDVVAVVPPPAMPVDHSVKAASIEVAWLQQPLTYPLHLRAECKPGEEAITITGYLPHDRMRERRCWPSPVRSVVRFHWLINYHGSASDGTSQRSTCRW